MYRSHPQGIGDFTDIETTPAVTHITFTDRRTAEKFYYSLSGGGKEIAGIEGQIEVGWVTGSVPTVAARKTFGVATATTTASSTTPAEDGPKQQENGGGPFMGNGSGKRNGTSLGDTDNIMPDANTQMDFDVADETDWDMQ